MRACTLALVVACSDPDVSPPDAAALPTAMPQLLSQTGLYADIAAKTIAPGVSEFTPANVLWSDGAAKRRWYRLPPGAQIDSSDMDRWLLPVGTQFFKEFSRDGKRVETRVIWRVADTGDRERDTLVGAFIWNDTETEAEFAPEGQQNARGTEHDVPSAMLCWRCHVGEPGRALGFTALQLGDVSALPLSAPPPAGTHYAAPNAAIGYLHANCGHCHNPKGVGWVDSTMILRLGIDDRDAATVPAVMTTVGVPLEQWIGRGFTTRIVARDPDMSAAFYRLSQRAINVQMPPLATERVDVEGAQLIRTWIESL